MGEGSNIVTAKGLGVNKKKMRGKRKSMRSEECREGG